MIHYHGTPISGTKEDAVKFLKGRHVLIPWPSPTNLLLAADWCRSFCIDNGAFTFWRKKKTVNWNKYYDWVEPFIRHPGCDFSIIPDIIDGDETANDKLVAEWPHGDYGVPVWHLHESLERLYRLANDWRTVAIGSSGEWPVPGAKKWWVRMDQAMLKICKDGKPICRLHGLRMLNPKIFTRLPLASADSTNAVRNASSTKRFGMYLPASSGTRMQIIAERIEAFNSAGFYTRYNPF